ncbi:ATP-dependent RNA helicase [Trypanosoma cruzi Dm28c]|uniref:ATP-dependent RNA helicase n=1 Tax=Trypanosoma cruzi Dm28c TaxID=1416333 RepID=V5DNU7_TRYCR|nr:ATP-dependent RNA helicase [Trypanosoma cruzi Dm28c]
MPSKKPIRFEDLGLSTPLPRVLSTTREQKKKEKHEIKKEKNARLKVAEEQLSLVKATVEKHKAFVKKEIALQKEKKQKEERQYLLYKNAFDRKERQRRRFRNRTLLLHTRIMFPT